MEGTSEVRQTRIRAMFDPAFFEFVAFEPGNHPADQENFVAFGSVLDQVASGGGTLFGGNADTSGKGFLGRMIFRLIQEIGSEPKAISVISVRIAVSVDDEDIRRFDPGKFGVVALLDSPNDLVAWIIPKNILSLVFSTLGVVQMPHKFNAARRHKFDKVQYRVINWAEYNESLRR